VTRRGKVTLVSGSYQLKISELPAKLNPASVRATARGTAQARLLGVQVQRTYYSETPTEQVRDIENQIEALGDDIARNAAQAELLTQERAYLDSLAGQTETYAMAIASGEMSVDAQLEVFESLRARAENLDSKALELAGIKRELDRRLLKLQNELKQLRSAGTRERYTVLVEVEVSGGGELTLELVYMVNNARWEPLYDLRLSEDGDTPSLEIGYLAQVVQRTGEDWKDVTLSLSTARPSLAATLPELDPWYIAPVRPMIPTAARPKAAGVSRMMVKAAAPAPAPTQVAAEEIEAEVMTAEVEASGAAITYKIPSTATIPPDGEPHKVTVAYYPLTPELDFVSAPKLVEAAYRRAKVINDSPYTLLPGEANLFAGEEFIGTTKLKLTAPKGEIELYLGTEDRIKVERELKRRDVDKRIIGGKRRIRYGYEIKLENLLPRVARISLQDQFPLPKHEDIKVKLEVTDPKPTEQDKMHLLTWEFDLIPRGKQDVFFEFGVEYPQDMILSALP
jgi:uncharacterized protein (TIGR02231 family)